MTSPPSTSSAFGTRSGRGLRQKMVDELKSVRSRKSPATEKRAPRVPPPLELNEEEEDDEEEPSPDTPVSAQTKSKGCSLCERSFTVFRAKHTCKMCAQKICDDCSKNRIKLHRRLERKKGSRLCDPCARSYIHTESNGDEAGGDAFPDHSPALTSVQSAYIARKQSGENFHALARSHTVPTKTLAAFIKEKSKQKENVVTQKITQQSVVTKARAAVHKRVMHPSHLRTRHWVSLLVVAVLVALRVFYYSRRNGVDGNTIASTTTNATVVVSPPYSFVERALDNLLSMRTLGTYLFGLVVFDEMSRPKSSTKKPRKIKQRRRRRSRQASTSQQRGRTQSSLSDSNVTDKQRAVETLAPLSPNTSQDDELEVNTGDIEGNNEQEGFSLDKLVASLDEGVTVRAPDGALQLGKFMASCNHICGFLSVFGRATSFAGSTVGAYFTSIDHNLESWSAPSSSNTWKEQSVIAVIEHEVDLKVANVGGKKKPSCSRCLLRLLWFVEFVEACVRHTLLESTDDNCYAGASKAYEETLGKRHPWLVRKGVNTALGSIPTRSHILTQLHLSDDNGLEPLRRAHKELAQIVTELEGVFEQHGLQDLK
ncbi:Glycolipid transfer protein (GLTP) [Phytophthora boehmeriae]|uniref:Glycolipid transfer protein (GLTP) n=1 Tax=Phytophthora boehmeriae TaxID=109152 RepID=A0A8T1WST0_9STRA|nr:Glycolipid transfer protein (GLTP) [Phytophthora boehmeriae]